MARYIVSQVLTPVSGLDVFTLIAASSGRLRVIEVSAAGIGTTSAEQLLLIARSSGGTTPGAAITPSKIGPTDQVAMVGTAFSSWSAQPTINTNSQVMGFNALGGANRWQPIGGAFEMRSTSEYVSIRASTVSTWQACAVSAIVEENYG
jgi:hypothetical protein